MRKSLITQIAGTFVICLALTACGKNDEDLIVDTDQNFDEGEETLQEDTESEPEETDEVADEDMEGDLESESEDEPEVEADEDDEQLSEDENLITDDDAEDETEAAEEDDDESGNPRELTDETVYELLSTLASQAECSADDIKYYIIDDFDGDGSFEGFALIGGDVDPEFNSAQGSIWYVSDHDVGVLRPEGNFLISGDEAFFITNCFGQLFVEVQDVYVTSNVSYIYYVDEGEVKESDISGLGYFYEPEGADEYCISYSEYDQTYTQAKGSEEGEYTGHTWKPYYFYYDKDAGDFREYEGHDISESELTDICGFDLAAQIRAEGFEVFNIMRRDNGIVNVNYCLTTQDNDGNLSVDYANANYDERENKFIFAIGDDDGSWKSSDFGGTYLARISQR